MLLIKPTKFNVSYKTFNQSKPTALFYNDIKNANQAEQNSENMKLSWVKNILRKQRNKF